MYVRQKLYIGTSKYEGEKAEIRFAYNPIIQSRESILPVKKKKTNQGKKKKKTEKAKMSTEEGKPDAQLFQLLTHLLQQVLNQISPLSFFCLCPIRIRSFRFVSICRCYPLGVFLNGFCDFVMILKRAKEISRI